MTVCKHGRKVLSRLWEEGSRKSERAKWSLESAAKRNENCKKIQTSFSSVGAVGKVLQIYCNFVLFFFFSQQLIFLSKDTFALITNTGEWKKKERKKCSSKKVRTTLLLCRSRRNIVQILLFLSSLSPCLSFLFFLSFFLSFSLLSLLYRNIVYSRFIGFTQTNWKKSLFENIFLSFPVYVPSFYPAAQLALKKEKKLTSNSWRKSSKNVGMIDVSFSFVFLSQNLSLFFAGKMEKDFFFSFFSSPHYWQFLVPPFFFLSARASCRKCKKTQLLSIEYFFSCFLHTSLKTKAVHTEYSCYLVKIFGLFWSAFSIFYVAVILNWRKNWQNVVAASRNNEGKIFF